MSPRAHRLLTWIWACAVTGCVGAPPPPPSQGDDGTGSTSDTDPVRDPASTTGDGVEPTADADSTAGPDSTTTGKTPVEGRCQHYCISDADCLVGRMAGLSCVLGTCVDPDAPPACSSDGQCVSELSGWADGIPCNSRADCRTAPARCIGVGGQGYCVDAPEPGECRAAGLDRIEVVDVQGRSAEVCGYADAWCGDDGACRLPCGSDRECGTPRAPVCDLVTGRCGCATDQHCLDAAAGDVCLDGQCLCTSAAACEGAAPFDGGLTTCEPAT